MYATRLGRDRAEMMMFLNEHSCQDAVMEIDMLDLLVILYVSMCTLCVCFAIDNAAGSLKGQEYKYSYYEILNISNILMWG